MTPTQYYEELRNMRVRTSSEGFYIGVDLGQKRDPSAIGTIEKLKCISIDRDPICHNFPVFTVYDVRHLYRPPLGTSYIDIVDLVADQARHCNSQFSHRRPYLVVDGTGVGAPVVDHIRKRDLPAQIVPVTIVAGETETFTKFGYYHVPKRNLISGLQLIVEQQRLRLPRGLPDGDAFLKELMNMRLKITADANETYSAWRDSDHDDLVLAVALATWRASKWEP